VMPPKKGSGARRASAKKAAPVTKDALFNNLKKDLENTIRWQGLVDNAGEDDESHNESLDAAVKKLYDSAKTFATRPDELKLSCVHPRVQPLHLTDEQRRYVRKLWQELKEVQQRYAECDTSKPQDNSQDFPSLEGFQKAFGLQKFETGAEEEEHFWLPKKRTHFPGGSVPEEPIGKDTTCTLKAFEVMLPKQ
jgi:hypothetical protein